VKPSPRSHGRSKASVLALDATTSRGVEATRDVGVLVPRCSVWDPGATIGPFQQRRSHESDPSDPEDLEFGREDLLVGCKEGIYEEVTTGEAERIRSTGVMIL
jgi:hypothetical protein